jgi:hypothetical protein
MMRVEGLDVFPRPSSPPKQPVLHEVCPKERCPVRVERLKNSLRLIALVEIEDDELEMIE